MSEACCACLNISYDPIDAGHDDGSILARWACDSCGKEFVPDKSFQEKMSALVDIYPDIKKALGMREELSDNIHESWSRWMKYLFSKCRKFSSETGEWIMPKWSVDRWMRQMETPYSDLPEEEKDTDRAEADKIIELLRKDAEDA